MELTTQVWSSCVEQQVLWSRLCQDEVGFVVGLFSASNKFHLGRTVSIGATDVRKLVDPESL